jgi:hypothetical protein
MKRLFWIGVGAVGAVVVIRKAGALIERHTPPGVTRAAGVVTGCGAALRAARAEFTAGLAEREAELRHDLLGDVDLDEARARTEARRAQRDGTRRAPHAPSGHPGDADPTNDQAPDGDTEPTSDVAQDPDDDELGYSFF